MQLITDFVEVIRAVHVSVCVSVSLAEGETVDTDRRRPNDPRSQSSSARDKKRLKLQKIYDSFGARPATVKVLKEETNVRRRRVLSSTN